MHYQHDLFEETEIEDPLGGEGVIPYSYNITSYGMDYPVDAYVKRLIREDIFIPSFQREYVWSRYDASRFVESLLLGLPVPGIFLSKERDTEKLLVIDGQQRLRSLQFFYEERFRPNEQTDMEFKLVGVQDDYEGKTYETLSPQDRRRLDDSILHGTVVKQDEPSDDSSSIYHIFERINSGGKSLSSQEIRACLYHGSFRVLLEELNENEKWRDIFGKVSKRMRDQELILRFLALYFYGNVYESPMKGFLNRYMGGNCNLEKQSRDRITRLFESTIDAVYKSLGEDAFHPSGAMNAAVFDSVMTGVGHRLQDGEITDYEELKIKYNGLLNDPDYRNAYQTGTGHENSVRTRLKLAKDAFSGVE